MQEHRQQQGDQSSCVELVLQPRQQQGLLHLLQRQQGRNAPVALKFHIQQEKQQQQSDGRLSAQQQQEESGEGGKPRSVALKLARPIGIGQEEHSKQQRKATDWEQLEQNIDNVEVIII